MTIGIDLGDLWSQYCTLNEDGEVSDRGRFRTNPSGVDKRFRDLERVRVAMETGTHSIWVSKQIQELGHEVIVANVRELRAISHSDRKSDKVDAEKIARYPGNLVEVTLRAELLKLVLRPLAPCDSDSCEVERGGSSIWTRVSVGLTTGGRPICRSRCCLICYATRSTAFSPRCQGRTFMPRSKRWDWNRDRLSPPRR
jgi:hypothetical protein